MTNLIELPTTTIQEKIAEVRLEAKIQLKQVVNELVQFLNKVEVFDFNLAEMRSDTPVTITSYQQGCSKVEYCAVSLGNGIALRCNPTYGIRSLSLMSESDNDVKIDIYSIVEIYHPNNNLDTCLYQLRERTIREFSNYIAVERKMNDFKELLTKITERNDGD